MGALESFVIDHNSGLPVWIQIKNRIAYLIGSGAFVPGDRLPTVRALAVDLDISYNTVNKAYLSLVSDGYLESTRGRGVFVRDLDAEMDEEYTKDVDGIMSDCVAACRDLGLSLDDVQKCMIKKIKQIKKAEGLTDVGEGSSAMGPGRIVTIDVSAKRAKREGER